MFEQYAIRELMGYQKGLYGIRWNKDGEYLGAICGDRSVRIAQLTPTTSLNNVEIIHTIPTSSTMSQLCWSSVDSQRLALCSDDKLIELWDIRASRAAMKMQSLGSNINMDWSPCGHYLVVGNKSDNVCVIDVRTGNTVKKKKFHYEVNELAWSYNSDYILAAANSDGFGSVDVISFQSNEELEVADSILCHASNCFHLKLDPSYTRMAVSSFDQCISVWSLDTLISTQTLTLDSDIRNFSFNGDGRYIAVICDEPAVLICDCDSGESVAKINTRARNHMISWNPKHSHVIACMHENRNNNTSQFLKLVLFKRPEEDQTSTSQL